MLAGQKVVFEQDYIKSFSAQNPKQLAREPPAHPYADPGEVILVNLYLAFAKMLALKLGVTGVKENLMPLREKAQKM